MTNQEPAETGPSRNRPSRGTQANAPRQGQMIEVTSSTLQVFGGLGLGILVFSTALRLLPVGTIEAYRPLSIRLTAIAAAALGLMWAAGRLLGQGHPTGPWLSAGVLLGSPFLAAAFLGSKTGVIGLIVSAAIAAWLLWSTRSN